MRKIHILLILTLLSNFALCSEFFVTNTNDHGVGSLRQAIIEAQSGLATPPYNIIFKIPTTDPGYNPETGIWTIFFSDEGLPALTTGYFNIDGSTQTQFAGNTNPDGPEICLNGQTNSIEVGLFIQNSSYSTISNLIITEFLYGIQIFGPNSHHNSIKGNYIGCNHNGTLRRGNYNGIELLSGANNNTIGGRLPIEKNLISGNEYAGIRISDANNNLVINNWVGIDFSGTMELHNYDGITIEGASANNQIGGKNPYERNITSGNIAYGIDIFGAGCFNNLIQGNFIGTDFTGSIAIPNTYGILFDDRSHNNTVGGYESGEGNLISGNTAFGAYFYNNGTNSNILIGNLIGTDITATYAIPNETGVHIDGASFSNIIDKNIISGNKANGITLFATYSNYNSITRNLIGTDLTGLIAIPNEMNGILITQGSAYNIIGGAKEMANTIAFNKKNGIKIESENADFNLTSCNSFFNNAQLGIDLYPDDGINKNDQGDLDTGPNDLLNCPVIDTIIYDQTRATLSGSIDVINPNSTKIEIYKARQNQSGMSEGMEFIGVTSCNATGAFDFSFTPKSNLDYYVALAIDHNNNTSEFSIEYPKQPSLGTQNNIKLISSKVTIFPNPASNHLSIFVHSNINTTQDFKIITLDGKMIRSGTLLSNQPSLIDISSLPTGNYLFILDDNNILSAHPFIVVKH